MIIGVKLCFLFAAGIEPKGCRLTLKITDPEDLNRDVLKVQFYSLKTFCLGWLVLVFSRGESIAHVHPIPLCTRKIQKTTQKTTFCKACEIFRHFPQIFQNNWADATSSSGLVVSLYHWRNCTRKRKRLPYLSSPAGKEELIRRGIWAS